MSTRVLIIDDEPDILTYLAAVLTSHGLVPSLASGPDQGLEMAADIKPDLICLDIMMPEKSGISIYTRLKSDRELRHIPVLIISGVSQEGEFDFRSYVPDKSIPPPDCYLEKPIVVDRFIQIVKKLTGSSPSPEGGKRKATNA